MHQLVIKWMGCLPLCHSVHNLMQVFTNADKHLDDCFKHQYQSRIMTKPTK